MPVIAANRSSFVATSGSIATFSDDSPAVATRTLLEVAVLRALMRQLTGAETQLPVRFFATKGEKSLRELVPQFWESRGVRPSAAAYLGPHAGFIAIRSDLQRSVGFATLLHEYVHLLIAAAQPDAPAWLDEGLAEFWGSLVIVGKQVIVGRPLPKHLAVLRSEPWIAIDTLTKLPRGTLPANRRQTELFYAQAWATVHFLMMGRGEGSSLSLIPTDVPAAHVLEQQVRAYISAKSFRAVTVPFTPPMPVAPQVTRISEARSLAERANMVVFGPLIEATLPLVRKALSLDPKDAVALEVMGTYHFLRNQPELARQWLTRALDANPRSYVSALYLSLLSSNAQDRERYLETAVAAKPDSTLAWERLWNIYREDGRGSLVQRWCRPLSRILLLPSPIACPS